MNTVLLDYDNTICNFSKGMFEKWNLLPEFNQYCKVELSDIIDYKLHYCLNRLGLDINKALDLLDKFWHIENVYQDHYYDMYCKDFILQLLQKLRKDGYFIELNTLCPSEELVLSKIKRISKDDDLIKSVDDIHIKLFDGKLNSYKSFNYDIVIEDNPMYIEEYLKHNKYGKVYMPLWKYNEYLANNDRITVI